MFTLKRHENRVKKKLLLHWHHKGATTRRNRTWGHCHGLGSRTWLGKPRAPWKLKENWRKMWKWMKIGWKLDENWINCWKCWQMLTDLDKLLTFPSDKLQRWRHPRHEWSPQRPNSRCPESDSGCVAVLWRFLISTGGLSRFLPESTRMNWSRFVLGSCWIMLDHVGSRWINFSRY